MSVIMTRERAERETPRWCDAVFSVRSLVQLDNAIQVVSFGCGTKSVTSTTASSVDRSTAGRYWPVTGSGWWKKAFAQATALSAPNGPHHIGDSRPSPNPGIAVRLPSGIVDASGVISIGWRLGVESVLAGSVAQE
jgi:hypothetical protein